MKKLIPMAIVAVMSLGFLANASLVQAQNGDCTTISSKGCTTTKQAKSPPKNGESSIVGSAFKRSSESSLSAAPKGQEYRVANDYLVLSDTKTKKIVKVLGLARDYTKRI